MHLFKSSFVIFALIISIKAYSFSTNECLKKDFNVQVDHKGFPFGLLEVKLAIEKQGCNITVSHQKYKYMNSQWMIDVCRGPVHIKKGSGAVDVIKKVNNCSVASKDEFCSEAKSIATTIQDDGLIFATGIKEDIGSDHGKAYCSFLLLNKYLQDSVVFNSSDDYEDDIEKVNGNRKKEEVASPSGPSFAPRPVMEGDSSRGGEESAESEAEQEDKSPSGEGSF